MLLFNLYISAGMLKLTEGRVTKGAFNSVKENYFLLWFIYVSGLVSILVWVRCERNFW